MFLESVDFFDKQFHVRTCNLQLQTNFHLCWKSRKRSRFYTPLDWFRITPFKLLWCCTAASDRCCRGLAAAAYSWLASWSEISLENVACCVVSSGVSSRGKCQTHSKRRKCKGSKSRDTSVDSIKCGESCCILNGILSSFFLWRSCRLHIRWRRWW